MKKAIIIQGGWDGHQPELVSARLAQMLLEEGNWQVDIEDNLECLEDVERLCTYDLLVSCWTMGKITAEQRGNVSKAVGAGMGLAGCHGGMCDAFREDVEWQFMTGGQWVSHPGGDGVEYMVRINYGSSPSLRVWRTLSFAVSIITSMLIPPWKFWPQHAFPILMCLTITFLTNRWICRWLGRNSGVMDGCSIVL